MYDLSLAEAGLVILALLGAYGLVFLTGFRRVPENQRGVVFRFGQPRATKGPGWVHVLPLVERMTRVDTRTFTTTPSPQRVTVADEAASEVDVEVDVEIDARVDDPALALVAVDDHRLAVQRAAEAVVSERLRGCSMGELHADRRAEVEDALRRSLAEATGSWGVDIESVRVRSVRSPQERERR